MHTALLCLLATVAATTTAAPTATTTSTDTPSASSTESPCKSSNCPKIPSTSHRKIHNIGNNTKTWPWQSFKTSPFLPPQLEITGPGSTDSLDPTYLFLAPSDFITGEGVKESLPLIMTNEGELVYAIDANGTTDFRVQNYTGKPHLTYWYGENTDSLDVGHGYGQVRFLDDGLNEFTFNPELSEINAQEATPFGKIDIHEHQITPDETGIVVTAYNNTPADLTSFGVKDGWVVDSLVIAFDVATGKQLFLWNPVEHGVSYNQSEVPLGKPGSGNGTKASPWDWCHINSAEKVGENYLINSRHLWTTWLVNGSNGDIIWEINGKTGGDFGPFPNGATFSWEHYVRAYKVEKDSFTYSMFDNHDNQALKKDAGPTNGLLLKLDLPPNKKVPPTVLRNLTVADDLLVAGSQGSYIPTLPNGNALMGYGQIAVTREYGPKIIDGDNQPLLRQWRFGVNNVVQSYRGFKFPWSATPAATDPKIVVEKAGSSSSAGDAAATSKTAVYVSWNGATEVTGWDVYAGAKKSALKFVGRAAKMGFETTFNVTGNCVQVAAVQGGKDVRRSNVACL